jgi:threonine dehydratase
MKLPVTYNDVLSAAEQIAGYAIYTPILESPQLNEMLGGRLLVKAESLQLAGSFKFRGAYNRISRLSEEEKKFGVVAFSSGNHAQGVALASKILSIPAVIVMPKDAPQLKIDNTRSFGAEIIFYDRASENREKISQQLAKERNATLVPSYDDPYIIAGQGTVGLEIVKQVSEMGAHLDVLISPCGGGGLISGTALAFSREFPLVEIYSAEPEGFDDTLRSLAAGERLPIVGNPSTFCDSLMLPIPGEITFPINMELLKGGFAIKDIDTARAMAMAFQFLKIVLEPGGAIALAAVINGSFDCKNKTVCVICSGGNVDSHVFKKAISKDILL